MTHGDGSTIEIHALNEAIHLCGSDTFAAFAGDFLDQGKDSLDPLARVRRDEDHRRVVQKLEVVAQALFIGSTVARALSFPYPRSLRWAPGSLLAPAHQAPLVDDDADRAPTLVGLAGDGSVQLLDTLGRVNHQQSDVCTFQTFARHDHR